MSNVISPGSAPVENAWGLRTLLTRAIGELQSVDGYMNIALEDTKEFVDGKMRRNYGDAFVRGNNGRSCNDFCMLLALRAT